MPKAKGVPERYSEGWLDSLDGRYAVKEVMQERFNALTTDLGGIDNLSYQERSLVERALWLEYWLKQQEKELAKGGEFEVGKWTQAVNSLQGILTKLGLNRRCKPVPDITEYLRGAG